VRDTLSERQLICSKVASGQASPRLRLGKRVTRIRNELLRKLSRAGGLAKEVMMSAIQPTAAALEAGLMEQEQHYPCSAVLP
jgi:hypothetical protein